MPDKALVAQLEHYLHENLNAALSLVPWADGGRLPLFLQQRYRFFEAALLGTRLLFMFDKTEAEESPAAIRKHLDQVKARWPEPVVYVRQRVTAYNRKRLIEQKVPFIVPGNQMYLPMLGIELREHFKGRRPDTRRFSPATQVVLIHALLRDTTHLGPTELAARLGYSVMTMSRALNELEAAELTEPSPTGRKRHLLLKGAKPAVWKKAQEFLRSPVAGRHSVRMEHRQELPGPLAGLSALAHYSTLTEPQGTVIAVSREGWRTLLKQQAAVEIPVDEPDGLVVEVWNYAPTLFASSGIVDRLSLYLSLRETKDERVEAALNQMTENIPW